MDNLFHYTTNEGAIGIINSGCLFATNYKYLNDKSELEVSRDIIVPLFTRELELEAHKLVQSGKLKLEYLSEYGRNIFQLEANRIFDIILRVTDNVTPIFITSFCQHHPTSDEWHHGLLSQWRGYGSRGGCSIEFDLKAMTELITREAREFAFTHVSLREVLYENYEKALDVNEIEGVARAMLRSLVERSEESIKQYEERIDKMYKAVAVAAPTLKKKGFKEEREVRVVAPLMRPRTAKEYPTRQQRSIHFRFKNGAPVPYVRLFEGTNPLPIRRIIVGPQQAQDKIRYALELALEAKGIQSEVTSSDIGYIPD